ncbi:MAG: DUF2889 domain-containing protein [Acidimicrobiia bacterium]
MTTDSSAAPVVRVGDPTTPYRRRIRLLRLDAGSVWGGLEDDFHHFEVTLHHDGGHVTALEMEALRWPWATCPDAGRSLQALVGMALSDRCTAVASVTDPRMNCTHQFDLAGLCVSHAVRGTESRQYDIELPPPHDGTVTTRLWRDGELTLEWQLAVGSTRTRELVSPPPFTEAPWRGGFMKWADATLPPEEAEAAIVLRRSCDIGMGRGMDLEAIPVSLDLAGIMTGICYSMQPDVMPVAFRNKGSIRDFGTHPDALLAGRPGAMPSPG